MKAAVIVFPGSNCDRDVCVALEHATGQKPATVWHRDSDLPKVDLIVVPGGFSYGDYLRSGAMAAQSPVMREVVARANAGVRVMGVCNGFQILTEARLLPGVLMRNAGLKFICRTVDLRVENTDSPFTRKFSRGEHIHVQVSHMDARYFIDAEEMRRLEEEGRVAFRVVDEHETGLHGVAGLLNSWGNVLGMMPHPERASPEQVPGDTDGRRLFESFLS